MLRETLAAREHEQWCDWMRWMFRFCDFLPSGQVVVRADKAERWLRLMNTPYEHLSEQEKESDRVEADKVMDILKDYHQE